MDQELLESIRSYVAACPGLRALTTDESERLRLLVCSRFAIDGETCWPWESVSGRALTLVYPDGAGLDLLKWTLPPTADLLYLFVTDDELPPWGCVVGKLTELIEMLNEQHLFEFFIVDSGLTWIVFDTHHNTLVSYGLPRSHGDQGETPSAPDALPVMSDIPRSGVVEPGAGK